MFLFFDKRSSFLHSAPFEDRRWEHFCGRIPSASCHASHCASIPVGFASALACQLLVYYFLSSWHGIFLVPTKSSAIKKIKLGPSWVSYVPIGTWNQHSGTDHMIILGSSFRVENPVFLWSLTTFSPTYSTGSFQPSKLWVALGQLRASYQCFAWFLGIFFNLVSFFLSL